MLKILNLINKKNSQIKLIKLKKRTKSLRVNLYMAWKAHHFVSLLTIIQYEMYPNDYKASTTQQKTSIKTKDYQIIS